MWSRRIPPHVSFLANSAVVLISALAVSVVAILTLEAIQRDINELIDQDLPAITFLLRLDRELSDAQRLLVHAHESPTVGECKAAMSGFQARIASIDDELSAFRTDLPGDGMAIGRFGEFKTVYHRWAARGLQSYQEIEKGAVRNDQVVKINTEFEALHALVAALEDDYQRDGVNAITTTIRAESARARFALEWTAVLAMGLGLIATLVIARSIRGRQRGIDQKAEEQARYHGRQQFSGRLDRALEMAEDEEAVLRLVEEVVGLSAPQVDAELLLADSSRAHMHHAASTSGDRTDPLCPVTMPRDCPAVRNGALQVFARSDDFDACPYLRQHSGESCSAVCLPITIMGQAVGVLHGVAGYDEVPDESTRDVLATVAGRASERIGMIRAFAKSQTQASTDPLTGLLNRRSFQDEIAAMIGQGRIVSVAYCDLDHFKNLNDTHGHDVGDRSLRLFGRVLRDSIRPEDLACRWGGEEFVVALADTSMGDAIGALERIRAALADALAGGMTPSFTVSMGVSDSRGTDDIESILAAADKALLTAKRDGRNRVVLARTVKLPAVKAEVPAATNSTPPIPAARKDGNGAAREPADAKDVEPHAA